MMSQEKNLLEHARDSSGPYDLRASSPRSMSLPDAIEEYKRRMNISDVESQPVELSDDEMYEQYEAAIRGTKPPAATETSRVDLSEEDRGGDDEEAAVYQNYLDVLSGEAARKRAMRTVNADFQARIEYWREADKRGEIVPRDVEDLI
jgi:hypothetical protein